MKYILSLFLLFSFVSLSAQNRFYVRASATGLNTGQNWSDAFTRFQSALEIAQAGDEIWVAEGTYYTTDGLDRDLSFEPKSGTKVFGGFAGTESSLSQRDLAAHSSILSADIGVAGDSTDNSYNVMYLHQPDSNTVIDGFTMRDGNANLDGAFTFDRSICGGGLYINGYNSQAYPEIRHCNFIHNTAKTIGGGAIVYGSGNASGTGSVAPRFINCLFEDNHALGSGGGLARLGGSWVERGDDLKDCVFLRNRAGYRGGGFYYGDTERSDHLAISGCRFEANMARNEGGGIYMSVGRALPSGFSITGTSFERNESDNGAAVNIINRTTLAVKDISIDECHFKDNIYNDQNLTGPKAAIYIKVIGKDAKGSFKNSVIEDHIYWENALLLDCSNTNFVCDKLIFRRNDTSKSLAKLNLEPEFEMKNSSFTENYIQQSIISNEYSSSYQNCIFHKNFSDKAVSYIEQAGYTLTLINCIFSRNNMQIDPLWSTAVKIAANCIFENIADKSAFLYTGNNRPAEYSYCYFDNMDCGEPNTTFTCGPGNIIGGDPMFRNRGNGDFFLLPCSPLINAGNNIAVLSILDDFNGADRLQGGTVDIGAFEAPAFALLNPPVVSPACDNSNGGAISIAPVNGCEPYTYAWEPPVANGGVLTELLPGTYSVTITDGAGRKIQRTIHVPEASAPELSPLVEDIQCGSPAGGSVTVAVNKGRSPFTFAWDNGAADSLLTTLSAGHYQVTVTDKNGCQNSLGMDVSLSGQLSIGAETALISCFGASDAMLNGTALDGRTPIAYLWSPDGTTNPLLTDLGPGTYTLTATDFYGCSASGSFTLEDPELLQVSANATATGNTQNPNGSASATETGGTQPYTYAWSNGAQTQSIGNLGPGLYTVTVTDAHGCSATAEAEVMFISHTAEAPDFQVKVWPNPMRAQLEIEAFNLPSEDHHLVLRDALGREMAEATLLNGKALLAVSTLPAGIYLWELRRPNKQVISTGKVMK